MYESGNQRREFCWRYKFGNFQHLDDIKAIGLDKTTRE